MRIAISGAHGVGKTTLAKSLAGKLNLPLVEEVVRSVASDFGYKTTEEIRTAEMISKVKFQNAVFDRQIEEETAHFVSDRSIFDCVGYCCLYKLPRDIVSYMRKEASKHSKKYDFIVYCPIPKDDIISDGFRLTDKCSQRDVNFYIYALLMTAECPVLWLGENRDLWEEEVLEYIRGRKG